MAARFGGPAGIDATHVHLGASSARDLGKPTAATEALYAALDERPLTYLALAFAVTCLLWLLCLQHISVSLR